MLTLFKFADGGRKKDRVEGAYCSEISLTSFI